MEMKVVFLVVKLCIIIIVSLVHDSAGYTISPSPTIVSIPSPAKARTPSPVYDDKPPRTSSPSLPPLPTVIHAPEVSQPGKTAPVPKSIAPSEPPSPPKVVPSLKPAPLPQVIQDSSMPPSPPKVVPSQKPAPLPHVVQGLVPSLPPSHSEVVPSQKPAPLPQVIQGFVPSMPPSPPKVVPSQKPAPLPQVIQGFVPSMPPSLPKVVPSNKPAPQPQVIQGFVPSMPPNPPLVIPSHNPAPPPQVIQGFVPSTLPNPPLDIPSHKTAPPPQVIQGLIPSMPPNPPLVIPSHKPAPPPQVIQGFVPSMLPNPPLDITSHKPAPPPQVIQGLIPSMPPIDTSHRRKPKSKLPVKMPLSPAPTASPPRKFPQKPPDVHPATPGIAPSMLSDPALPPISVPPPSSNQKMYRGPLAAPPLFHHYPRAAHPPTKGSFPVVSPQPHKAIGLSNAPAPSKLSPKPTEKKWIHSPALSPLNSFYRYHHARKNASYPALAPSFLFPPPSSYHQGPIIPPATSHSPSVLPKKHRRRQRHPPAMNNAPSVSPIKPPFPPTVRQGSPVPSPASAASSGQTKRTFVPPTSSPSGSFPRKPKTPLPSPVQSLPPPPPNQDCTSLICTEPLTNSPPGSPCGCVAPMQVGLRLSVALYTFFPLVSELAEEIATGVFMKLSQVRIMGANAAGQQLDKTTVLIDLVPLGEKFDNTTALLAYEKFWHKQVDLKPSSFGDYEVLYVRYPGLPPSPPFASSSITTIDGQYPRNGNNARTIKPLGVDVKRKRNGGLGGSMIAIIILSSSIALALFIGAAWLLLLKCRNHNCQLLAPTRQLIMPSLSKPSGTAGSMMFGSGPSSASMSFGSSLTTHPGTAKTFSAGEIEKATDNFAASRILGEGGFGLVYRGILDDGTEVAVKVLKRDDQQGGREFLAEVEMLSRLHHRNLVKLIGICIEDHALYI